MSRRDPLGELDRALKLRHLAKQGTSGPAGRLSALDASLCLGFRRNTEFRGIPQLNGTKKTQPTRGGEASTPCYSTIKVEVALPCLSVSLLPPSSFLPPVPQPVRAPAPQSSIARAPNDERRTDHAFECRDGTCDKGAVSLWKRSWWCGERRGLRSNQPGPVTRGARNSTRVSC